jgi:P pilus assembly chaperone PapD
MTLEEGEQRVIRVGYRGVQLTRERVCRILIVERSGAAKNESGRRPTTSPVSVPVFIKPIEEKVAGSLQTIVLSDGQLTIVVKNTGNAHLIVISVSIRGAASDG